MSPYDEAMKELQDYINEYGMDYYDTKHYPITIKALERAKKVEELLGLYRIKDMFSETYISRDFSILRGQEVIDTLRSIREEINIKEKELEEMK